ncbi:DUF2625 domain-containing protein [soil metagenome]
MDKRPLTELISNDPAWPMVKGWLSEAKNLVEVLPATAPQNADALMATQVTTKSSMGSIIYETGGILVDHGWIRILGSGSSKLPRTLPGWNVTATGNGPGDNDFLLIGDDVIGGFFALNGGGLSGKAGHNDQNGQIGQIGNVFYFAPDTLEWEDLDIPYSGFLEFCLHGDLETYYKAFRWKGWQADVAALNGDQAYSAFPFYFTETADTKRERKAVSVAELYELLVIYWPNQIEKQRLKPGQQIKIQISE